MAERGAEAARFAEYLERVGRAVGHADRREPLRAYLTGLLIPGERKSVEPMAAKLDPRHVPARHQSMHHFVAEAPWDDRAVLEAAREWVLPHLERHGPLGAWVVDDTGLPKKGTHSVGVARQYCGPLGKPENCQVAVTVSLVSAALSVPCAYRLYLPEAWVRDRRRRRAAHVPATVRFAPKWEIALAEVDRLLAAEVPRAPVVADAGYGNVAAFRDGVRARGLSYAVGVQGDTSVWPPGQAPLGPGPWCGWGPHPRRLRRSARHRPLASAALAAQLPASTWQRVRWRGGTCRRMAARGVASGRAGAHEVLAVDGAGHGRARRARPPRENPLAHRARLPRAQGRDRARSLRGPRLARFPSPRRLMHRRVRLPRGRARSAFPPSTSCLPPPRSRTPWFPPTRRCHCVLSVITRRRSRRCEPGTPAASSAPCRAVPTAEQTRRSL